MKNLVITMGLGLGVLALTASTAAAGCSEPDQDYPESKGWVFVDETLQFPAGFACNAAVSVRVVGHEKVTVNGNPPTGDPQPGDRIVSRAPDEKVTVTNVATGRKITKPIGGTFYDRVLANGKDLKTRGVGENLYFGPGINGLLWTDGVQHSRVYDFLGAAPLQEIVKIKGKAVDLCARVGARPVPGRIAPTAA